MANLLTGRLKIPPAGKQDWAKTVHACLDDCKGWPIKVGARVTVRRNGKRRSGTVTATQVDWKGRECVKYSVNGAAHVARPEDCRVQYRKGGA